jgi:hypothetical protein
MVNLSPFLYPGKDYAKQGAQFRRGKARYFYASMWAVLAMRRF